MSNRILRIILLLVYTCISAASRAADIYVDSAAPPGGSGSISTPFNALDDLSGIVADNDQVFLKGQFRSQPLLLNDLHDVTISNWPGESNPVLRSDISISPQQWIFDIDSSSYYAIVAKRPLHLVFDWDNHILPDGRHYGFLRRQINFNNLQTGEWYFDGINRLYMKPPVQASQTPNLSSDVYSYLTPGNGLRVTGDPTGIIVSGLNFYLWAYLDEVLSGYGVRIESSADCKIVSCNFIDCGKHSAGFVGNGANSDRMRYLTCRGIDPYALPNGGHLVFFSLHDDVANCLAQDCDLHLYNFLDAAGDPIGNNADGCFVHAAAPAIVQSVEWQRIACTDYDGNMGIALNGAYEASVPLDPNSLVVNTYPIRYIDCVVNNAMWNPLGGGPGNLAFAFQRCIFSFTRCDQMANPWVISVQDKTRALFESCVISANGEQINSGAPRLFDVPPDARLMLTGCVVYVAGSRENNCAHIRQNIVSDTSGPGNAFVLATQTVFAREDSGPLLRGNQGMSAENLPNSLQIQDCWYWNIDPLYYSFFPDGNYFIKTESNWESVIDKFGILALDPEFTDPANMDFEGIIDGNVRSITRIGVGMTRRGINRFTYSGHWGAYHYGLLSDFNRDGIITSADLGFLLGAWGLTTSEYDINGDGLVGASDLSLLLGEWFH